MQITNCLRRHWRLKLRKPSSEAVRLDFKQASEPHGKFLARNIRQPYRCEAQVSDKSSYVVSCSWTFLVYAKFSFDVINQDDHPRTDDLQPHNVRAPPVCGRTSTESRTNCYDGSGFVTAVGAKVELLFPTS
ncbi:hypothetical protein AUEXF2481DRAFT_328692 [Aureobasidium subglaciale EXF-2481]|uniref:Uncharacterized protein n=1 Tax=Aureobasidium subglaciale (strain EXF-2481) TaxID=1043005 RepID=A0A074YHT5_AURSE|nr:uncharacterized protein AUEXF2481DRAFT_328692 [Aureobasidium subglaciale EXF-2481]KEQ93627.1 hypothetical protein AUEXF2481DRAFT_328692 [Aureobasidium subglaciale EXF-2481]